MENQQTTKKLYRSRTDRIIAGVCGGLGKYFGIDPLIFRILFLVFVFGGGFGILLYIILALIIPLEPLAGGNPEGPIDNDNNLGERIRENANDLAREIRGSRDSRSMRNILGLLIVAFGIFLLLGNLFPGFMRWDLFWPLALIALGLVIVSRKK